MVRIPGLRMAAVAWVLGAAVSPVSAATAAPGQAMSVGTTTTSCISWYSTSDKGLDVINNCSRGWTAVEYCSNGYYQGTNYVPAYTREHHTRTWWCTGKLVVRYFT